MVLCLNGHSIKLDVTSSHVYGNTIRVAKDVTLNIVDCKGTGTITHGSRANGCGVTVAAGGTLNLYGAVSPATARRMTIITTGTMPAPV